MHKLKIILKYLLCVVYGVFYGIYTPVIISFAFNFMKGVGNNPEGTIFVPFGIVILLSVIVIDIAIIVKTIKSDNMTRLEKVLAVSLFVIAKFIGLMVDQDGWRNVIHCLEWKFMQY